MRGELLGVWPETWRQIWIKLAKHPAAPEDLFCELYRELIRAFQCEPDVTALADIIDNPSQSRQAFRSAKPSQFKGEIELVAFMEACHRIVFDLGGESFSNRYFLLTNAFIEKYSLRYDLRRPFSLHPTLPGIFSRLVRELKKLALSDAHLDSLMRDFEESLRDLKHNNDAGRIKTCLSKNFQLLEGIAGKSPGVTEDTLGAMCRQLEYWPHTTIRETLSKLYGFASNYPGIRHAGNHSSQIREIEMRDMIAISVLLAGFTPYLTDQMNLPAIYGGSTNP